MALFFLTKAMKEYGQNGKFFSNVRKATSVFSNLLVQMCHTIYLLLQCKI